MATRKYWVSEFIWDGEEPFTPLPRDHNVMVTVDDVDRYVNSIINLAASTPEEESWIRTKNQSFFDKKRRVFSTDHAWEHGVPSDTPGLLEMERAFMFPVLVV